MRVAGFEESGEDEGARMQECREKNFAPYEIS